MVKVLFDTNVLVGAFLPEHKSHAECVLWLQQAQLGEVEGFVGTHSLAELYSNLTKLPLRTKITPALAEDLIKTNLNSFVNLKLHLTHRLHSTKLEVGGDRTSTCSPTAKEPTSWTI